MRTLILLRHATAASPPGVDDAERGLTDAGRDEARDTGRRLPDVAPPPDLVLCSTARRARETAQALDLPADVEVWYERDLYLAGAGVLLDRVSAVDDDVQSLLVVGHNPGLHQLVLTLGGVGPEEVPRFSPASLAVLQLPESWAALAPGTAALIRVHHAR